MNKLSIAFYKGKPRPKASLKERLPFMLDGLIRLYTRSPYSHCELVRLRDDGAFDCLGASIREGGIRVKVMNLAPERWDLVPCPKALDFEALARDFVGIPYDFRGVLGFLLPFVRHQRSALFCSEFIAQILELPTAHRHSPASLYHRLQSEA